MAMVDLINVITPFLLPPGIFILFGISYGFWCLIKKNTYRGVLFSALGILAWGISIAPVSDAILKPLESIFNIPENPAGDVIIVLGAGINSEKPDFSGKGAPARKMLPRIVTGVRLQKKLGIPLLISGRGNSLNDGSTRTTLIRYLTDFGVPFGSILIEDKSRNTAENAAFSTRICQEIGLNKPILVTSAHHLKRAMLCFRHEGLQVLPFPSGFETWDGKRYTWMSFLPGDFRKSSIALHEYLGLLYYRIIGKL